MELEFDETNKFMLFLDGQFPIQTGNTFLKVNILDHKYNYHLLYPYPNYISSESPSRFYEKSVRSWNFKFGTHLAVGEVSHKVTFFSYQPF